MIELHLFGQITGTPNGIRTRVSALKGRCERLLEVDRFIKSLFRGLKY